MEIFDIVDENGRPTGKTVERTTAHREGIRHRTAHIWVIRQRNGIYECLLQKRSLCKDSFPGQYDTSSAGHIHAGDEIVDSAIRELEEELGIKAEQEDLKSAGSFVIKVDKVFHAEEFHDREIAFVFVYDKDVDIKDLHLQKEEVDEVRWFSVEETYNAVKKRESWCCVPTEGLKVLMKYLSLPLD